jgi:hypothetical protein
VSTEITPNGQDRAWTPPHHAGSASLRSPVV